MSDAKKILLVEGGSDKSFFEEICKNLDLDMTVKVAPPKELGGTHNSKQGVFNHLSDILLPQLADGQYTNIAAIVDADYLEHGSGTQKTLEKVSSILSSFGFTLKNPISNQQGLLFEHADGLADFGLWMMPDNQSEGMLENWIKACISHDEEVLFQQASTAVSELSSPKFKSHLTTKAEVATWLAWQKTPGHGLYSVMNRGLLDEDNELHTGLKAWLNTVFNVQNSTLV